MIIEWRGKRVYITGWEPDAPSRCEMCHCRDALRPFGPNGQFICALCAERNPKEVALRIVEAQATADIVVTAGYELPKLSEDEIRKMLDDLLIEA